MLCRFCGTHIDEGAKRCPLCGNPVGDEFRKSRNAPISIAAFVCGLASLLFCVLTYILFWCACGYAYIVFSVLYPALAVAGIVCGAIALAKQKSTRLFAVTGVIVGCVVVFIKIISMVFLIGFLMHRC